MKPFATFCFGAATALAAALAAWALAAAMAPAPEPGAVQRGDIDALRAQLDEVVRRLHALERTRPLAAAPLAERADARALPPPPAAAAPPAVPRGAVDGERDPYWYLQQYVASFADGDDGVEYYRLAVEAHVAELALPIATLVRESTRPLGLRIRLATMLGSRRFAEMSDVIDALLAAVSPPSPEPLALVALQTLERIRSPLALPGLEAAVPACTGAVREHALALLVELAGEARNDTLLRLFVASSDEGLQRLLLRHVATNELRCSLDLLRAAARAEQPVRLDAAKRTHDFDDGAFESFVADWKRVETDTAVRDALAGGGAGDAASWTPRKATGAPDADPRKDDPNAWAPKQPEMGEQWLQLGYATAVHATGVRVFEINAPGAIAEVRARKPDGAWLTVWRGTANGNFAPLELTFPRTPFATRTIRLVLDTNRTPGWNEIDAVELLGDGTAQWAVRATASSSFGGGGSGGAASGKAALDEQRRMFEGLRQQRR
jgi:hypothetical protein